MISKTTFVDKEEFQKNTQEFSKGIFDKYKQISSLFTEELTSIDTNTLHMIGKLLKVNDPAERGFYRLLGSSLLQAEALSGGAASIGLVFSLAFLKHLTLNSSNIGNLPDGTITKEYEGILVRLREIIQETYQIPTLGDIERNIQETCGEDLLSKVVFETVKLAGLEGKIYIEDGRQQTSFVLERRTGYGFKVKPFKFFLSSSNLWERQNVKVLMIDGVVERVSEIDQILNAAMNLKQSGIILARGFSEEVIATLKANFDRGIIDIVPVQVNSDLESINILNDIAAVCGSDVVSSLKGEMICFVKWEQLPTVRKVRCLLDKIVIEEETTRPKVNSQLKYLLNKRYENQNLEDIVNLLDERIKSLTAESVIIRLPAMTHVENQTAKTKFDTSLRNVKSMLNNGLVNLNDVVGKFGAPATDLERVFLQGLKETAKHYDGKPVSSLSLYLALNICGKQTLLINSSGGLITEVE